MVTSIGGLLRTLSSAEVNASRNHRTLNLGLPALDELMPEGALASGAVHEVLSPVDAPMFLLPLLMARSAVKFGRIAWCDSQRQLYPPAAAAMGLPLDRLVVLRPKTPVEEIWAVTECLRCRGIAACIAPVARVSRVQARRLQLAAERGGGIGILMRPASAINWPYAAATRWLVQPARGEQTLQRWKVELIHGHGGRVGQSVLLEVCRETHHVRAIETMVDRPDQKKIVTVA